MKKITLIGFSLFFFCFTLDVQAQIFVNSNASGANNGSSWTNAYTSLQDALAASTSGDEIWVAAGTYKPSAYPENCTGCTTPRDFTFQLKEDISLYGSFAGTETQLNERNIETNTTILSGDIGTEGVASDNVYHVVLAVFTDVTPTTRLDGFSITGGNGNGTTSITVSAVTTFRNSAGGVYTLGGNNVIANNKIYANSASFGAGILTSGSENTIVNNSLSGNDASQFGGGIYINGGQTHMVNNSISGNNSPSATGGGVHSFGGVINLANNIIWGNTPSEIVNQSATSTYTANNNIVQGGFSGTGNLDQDPLFVEAVPSAPSSEGDLRLQVCSLAINAGDNTSLPTSITSDLAGNTRVFGSTVDIGAYELQTTPLLGNVLYVNQAATGANSGTSWTDAFTNLQDALGNTCAGVTEIWVAQGTYYPDEGAGQTNNNRNATFQLKNGVALYAGFVGNETQLSERDWTTNETILSGDINQSGDFTGNTLTVVTGSGTDVSAVIDGFTITWGNEDAAFLGAGMLNVSGSPTIRNNKFSNNKALVGGGIFNQNSSSPVIINCSFIGNQVSFGGGGILNQANSSPAITNCLFSGNLALNGGGVYNDNNCSPVIVNSTFTNNTVQDNGGGIFNNINSNPTLTNTILWNNTASGTTTTASASIFNQTSNPTFSHSLIANSGGSAGWDTAIGTDGGNNIATDPQFNDPNNADFRLQFGSPAINSGTPDTSGLNLPAEDFIGNPRIIDGIIDIGAFEFQGVQPISPDANNILYVNQSAVLGNQSGDSWENATLELRDALSWAANSWDGSNAPLQIWVAKGTYLPTDDGTDRNSFFQLVNNVEIYGGFNGNETDLSQRNFTTHETILSGDIDDDETLQNNSYTIVNGSGTDATAVLDGFSITKGNADGVTEITARGAGMFNDAGSPMVSNCKFSGNSAVFGGGLYNVNNSSPSISNCSILDNQATASGGGLLNINSSPFVVNALFTGNSADNGGGLFNDATSSAIVTNTTFSENTAVFNGGAIFNGNSNPNLTNIIVWNNTADGMTTTASSSVFNSTSSPVISFSLIANSGSSVSWDSSIGTDDGNNLDTDPLFEDSTNGDFALNDNSPAKNMGTPDVTSLNLPAIDLAGNPRIFDGIIDMGAFENQITCPSTNIIYVSASATGNNLGTSWADAYTDLQDALDNNCAGVTEIWVAAGTYKPSKHPANCNGCNSSRDNTFQLKDGIALYGGFDGTETTLSERDFENNTTILSGDYNDDDTVPEVAIHSLFSTIMKTPTMLSSRHSQQMIHHLPHILMVLR